ncbi:MAG: hypothetical protein ABI598_03580 [Chloroflexota bacterium]
MSWLAFALWGAGVLLIGIGFTRARGPWARYQALRDEDANIARYEAWRGGLRGHETTGSSIAMQVLRRQARDGALIGVAGFLLVVAGFALPS